MAKWSLDGIGGERVRINPRLRTDTPLDRWVWVIAGSIGVNHDGQGLKGDLSLRIWRGDANANWPPDFVMSQNFKDQIACIAFAVQKTVMATLAVMATADKLHIIHFS